jgi:hypothetical protein
VVLKLATEHIEPDARLIEAVGVGFTVNTVVALHPVAKVYKIFGVPGAIAVTIPLAEPTVASAVLLLLQVPPAVTSLKVELRPEQIEVVPVITAGIGLTVTAAVARQPVPKR